MALQQQAVAAAANLSFLGPNSTGSWTPNLTAMTNHGNGSSLVISSSSPGGGSSSSGPTSGSSTGPSSNNRQEHLEAGKGYTFEEQFKQVCFFLFSLLSSLYYLGEFSFFPFFIHIFFHEYTHLILLLECLLHSATPGSSPSFQL